MLRGPDETIEGLPSFHYSLEGEGHLAQYPAESGSAMLSNGLVYSLQHICQRTDTKDESEHRWGGMDQATGLLHCQKKITWKRWQILLSFGCLLTFHDTTILVQAMLLLILFCLIIMFPFILPSTPVILNQCALAC